MELNGCGWMLLGCIDGWMVVDNNQYIPWVETKRVAGLPAVWRERLARRAAPKDRAMATIVEEVLMWEGRWNWGWNEGAMDADVVVRR